MQAAGSPNWQQQVQGVRQTRLGGEVVTSVFPSDEWERAVSRLSKRAQAIVRKDREELVSIAWRAQNDTQTWRRRADDCARSTRDRERYIRHLEEQLAPLLVREVGEQESIL
jgi:hypothetical protein